MSVDEMVFSPQTVEILLTRSKDKIKMIFRLMYQSFLRLEMIANLKGENFKWNEKDRKWDILYPMTIPYQKLTEGRREFKKEMVVVGSISQRLYSDFLTVLLLKDGQRIPDDWFLFGLDSNKKKPVKKQHLAVILKNESEKIIERMNINTVPYSFQTLTMSFYKTQEKEHDSTQKKVDLAKLIRVYGFRVAGVLVYDYQIDF